MRHIETLLNAKEETHPCFSPSAVSTCARVHLPVAPQCNVLCNYCNRDYDCINESRPGVASSIISPEEALKKVKEALSTYPQLSTSAVAGPGDALANPELTFKTLRLIHEEFPRLNICLSTNGLNIIDYIDEISDCGVSHLSVTVNSLDEKVSSNIYSFIKLKEKIFKGETAGRILIKRQLQGIRKLIQKDISVKVNSVVIPGINDSHLPFLAQRMKKEGVSLINFLQMIKVKGAKFENVPVVSEEFYKDFLKTIPPDVPLMKHCRMCRADAEGLLAERGSYDNTPAVKYPGGFLSLGQDFKGKHNLENSEKPFLIASAGKREGFIDKHFGRVDEFFIYELNEKGKFRLIEKRSVKRFCKGKDKCADRRKDVERIASILSDCSLLLCSGAGGIVTHLLEKKNIRIHIAYGRIDDVLADLKKELFS